MVRGGIVDPFKRDLYLLRVSAGLLCAGSLLFALAPDGGSMMAAQVVYGLSLGYSPQARALVTALADPDMLATLNTTLATLEGLLSVIAASSLAWLLGKGLELGGDLQGLPYLVLGGVAFLALITALFIKVPKDRPSS
jgi:MFS family permease